MARHVTSKVTGAKGVLFNCAKYSVTTSQHQSMVRRAIPSSFEVFEVPDVFAGIPRKAWERAKVSPHKGNLAYYKRQAEESYAKALRAVHSNNIQWASDHAREFVTEAIKYAGFFGLRPIKISEPWDAIQARLDYIREREAIRRTPEWEEKRKAQFERRHAALLETWRKMITDYKAKSEEKILQWRAGENVNFYPSYPSEYYKISRAARREFDRIEPFNQRAIPTMLRISKDGSDVETSLGARVPVSHAVRGLRFVRNVVKSGQEYQRNGHTLHLGHYAIDRIEANGTLHAGCHVISYEEITRLAPSLESLQVSEISETPETV